MIPAKRHIDPPPVGTRVRITRARENGTVEGTFKGIVPPKGSGRTTREREPRWVISWPDNCEYVRESDVGQVELLDG